MNLRPVYFLVASLITTIGPSLRASDLRADEVAWVTPVEAARANEIVDLMMSARSAHALIAPPSLTHGLDDIESAYRIQRVFAEKLRPLLGPVAGFKVAFASTAAQEQFGIDEPACGPLFLSQRIPSGSTISVTSFQNIYLEVEVAFTVGRPIDARADSPLRSVDELHPLVRSIHAAFDVGDGRFDLTTGSPGVADQVASGCAAHYFVLGAAIDPSAFDPGDVVLKLFVNGRTVRESPATEVMGNPWNSLLWLVNRVLKNGGRLEPGDVVLTGTAALGFNAAGDDLIGDYVGDCGALGQVTIRIE